MAEYKESSGFCPTCQRRVVGRREEASHTFWLIATLFSCGLFGIVWIISSLVKAGNPFHCSICGTPLQALPSASNYSASSSHPAPSKGSPSPLLIVGGIIGVFTLLPIFFFIIGGAMKPKPSATITAQPVTTVSPTPPSQSKANGKSYKDGYTKGVDEGNRWSRDPEQGMPEEAALEPMSRNVAGVNGKGDDFWTGRMVGLTVSRRDSQIPEAGN